MTSGLISASTRVKLVQRTSSNKRRLSTGHPVESGEKGLINCPRSTSTIRCSAPSAFTKVGVPTCSFVPVIWQTESLSGTR